MSFLRDIVVANTTQENAALIANIRDKVGDSLEQELVDYFLLTVVNRSGTVLISGKDTMKWLEYDDAAGFEAHYKDILAEGEYTFEPGHGVRFTVDGFKNVCMSAEGDKGSRVRRYCIDMIKVFSAVKW